MDNEKTKLNNTLLFVSFLIILLTAGSYIFGVRVLYIAIISLVIAFLTEYLFFKASKKKMGYSWIITALLFTLLLPPTLPLWIAGVGIFFGTFFAKLLFGGEGKYIFNPAVVGVLFITISFPVFLNTKWLDPVSNIETTITPLINLARGGTFNFEIVDLFFGQTSGLIGETFRIGILILGTVLILFKLINWRTPVTYIVSFFLFTLLFNTISPETARDPFISLITGGLLLAAFFVAPDPTTSPTTNWGIVVYGLGLGLITAVIRHYAVAPEGIIFAIIIMNAVAPLIDSFFEKELKEVS